MVRILQSSAWLVFFGYVSVAYLQIPSESTNLDDFEGIRSEEQTISVTVANLRQVLTPYPESLVGNRNTEPAMRELQEEIAEEEQHKALRPAHPYHGIGGSTKQHLQMQRRYLDLNSLR